MDITQGKLVLGLDVTSNIENISYVTMCYNTILGGGANSKMFQNVREKASLAYTVGSNYLKKKTKYNNKSWNRNTKLRKSTRNNKKTIRRYEKWKLYR